MDELINVLVIWVVGIVAGMVLHSAGGHAGYNQRVRDWIEKNILMGHQWKYRCKSCGYKTDSHVEFQYHSCYLNAQEEGTRRELD